MKKRPLYTPRPLVVEDTCDPMLVDQTIHEFERYLKRTAAYIARNVRASSKDMVQEARITLWELDLGRFGPDDEKELKRRLCARMTQVYRHELRGGMTNAPAGVAGRVRRLVED